MSMGPRDYAAIASVLKAACTHALTLREKQMLLGLASSLADVYQRQSVRFQRPRFMDATGTDAFNKEVQ